MYDSTHRSFWLCVCVCAYVRKGVSQPTSERLTVVTMATNRKRCASFYAAEPGHPDNSLFPPVWPLHSSADKHSVGSLLKVDKSGLKEFRNLRSSVYFSLLVLWIFTTLCEGCKWAQQSELCHHISLRLAKPPLPKTTVQSPQFASRLHSITILLGTACVGPTRRLNSVLVSVSSVTCSLLAEDLQSYKIVLFSPYWCTFGIPLKSEMSHWYFE